MKHCRVCGNPTMGDLCPECAARYGTGPQGGSGQVGDPGAQSPFAPPAYPGAQTPPPAYPSAQTPPPAYFGATAPPPAYPGAQTPPPAYPGAQTPPTGYPGQSVSPQGPEYAYRPAPHQPTADPSPWAYPSAAVPGAATRARTGRGATVALVAGLAVVVLAAGVGMVLLLLGGGREGEVAADPVVATPAPASTVFVTLAPSVEETTPAAPSTAAASADAPSVAAQPTAQPAEPTQAAPADDAPVKPQVFVRYYPLFRGDQGYVVLALQELLSWRGVRTLADGDFGPATERSVRQWQAQNGLDATGAVDDTTWDSLVPRLSEGSQGEGVAVMQRLLGYRGYDVVVDGDFGPQTDAVVRAFQSDRGLPVDGVVGPVTWSTLLA